VKLADVPRLRAVQEQIEEGAGAEELGMMPPPAVVQEKHRPGDVTSHDFSGA